MKKIFIACLSIFISCCYADEIDLINTHVTCGSYALTVASTTDEITKNCKMHEMETKRHLVRANKTELEFTTDQYKLVKCSFKKNQLDKCSIKKK